MTLGEVMEQLRTLGGEKVRQIHLNHGAAASDLGVKLGDLRTLAKRIKTNHELALELWATGVPDAMLLATLVIRPKQLSEDDLDVMVRSVTYNQLADWLSAYVVKAHPQKEALRQRWMESTDPMAGRAGWSLTTDRVSKEPQGLDLSGLLDRIEKEMTGAPEPTQWTMNFCLAAIGINHPEHRERAVAIGERLGLYRDYPVSKGCTSPFAPIWIAEMVGRQG